MKKIVRLTESDLIRLVKRVIKESEDPELDQYLQDLESKRKQAERFIERKRSGEGAGTEFRSLGGIELNYYPDSETYEIYFPNAEDVYSFGTDLQLAEECFTAVKKYEKSMFIGRHITDATKTRVQMTILDLLINRGPEELIKAAAAMPELDL